MTAEFNDKGEYKEILRIDFTNEEEYRNFIADLAQMILYNFQFTDELDRDIADEIVDHRLPELADAILEKLIAKRIES